MDILDVLVTVLCQQNTESQCQTFISGYSEPLQQLFFFFLFPIVFLVIFVTILSREAVPRIGPKFGVLISAVIAIFVVVQGYYHLFLFVSRLWLYFIVLFLGLWIILKYFVFRRPGGGGKPSGRTFGEGGGSSGGGGSGNLIGKHISEKVKATRAQFDPEAQQLILSIDNGLDAMRGIVNAMQNAPREARGEYPKAFAESQRSVNVEISKLHAIAGDRATVYRKEMAKIVDEFQNVK